MSIVKLAALPVVVINKTDPSSGSSKTFNFKNIAAATAGGTTGFAASQTIEKMKNFNPSKTLHQYGKRMGSVLGGFAGAATTYALLNKNKKQDQSPKFYML